MKLAYSTGNAIVDEVSELNITGNIIPMAWFQTMKGPSGKPMLLAISILSDILYWYRPKEIRDEGTGGLIGYKKRFKADLLQRSYRQIEEQFGVTKKQARGALDYLCKIGVIKKHLRDEITKDGVKLHNNMYLELVPTKLRELTYPSGGCIDEGVPFREVPYAKKDNMVVPSGALGDDLEVTTSTEITTENTTIDYSHPIYVTSDKDRNDEVESINAYREIIRENIDYDHLMAIQNNDSDRKRIDEIYEIICDVVCSKKDFIRVGREDKPGGVVKSVFLKLTGEHIEYVTECLDKTYSEIGNIRAYLITSLYYSAQTAEIYNNQKVNHGQHEYATRNRELGGANGEDD